MGQSWVSGRVQEQHTRGRMGSRERRRRGSIPGLTRGEECGHLWGEAEALARGHSAERTRVGVGLAGRGLQHLAALPGAARHAQAAGVGAPRVRGRRQEGQQRKYAGHRQVGSHGREGLLRRPARF